MTPTDELLGPILRDVSRAFYLTLRVLPGEVRQSIGLFYLLARTTDTIADTELIPANKRMLKLRQYRDRVRSEGAPMPDFSHLVREQQDDGERRLLSQPRDHRAARANARLRSWADPTHAGDHHARPGAGSQTVRRRQQTEFPANR